MTLMLRKSIQFPTLLQQLKDLHDTLLLFLKKIRKISIRLHSPPNGESAITTYTFREDKTLHRVTLTKSSTTKDSQLPSINEKFYYMVRRAVTGLPVGQQRADEVAEVILAFPITPEFVPIFAQRQKVYAYLPIRDFGFNVSPPIFLPSRGL
jgi:hypothetical protein